MDNFKNSCALTDGFMKSFEIPRRNLPQFNIYTPLVINVKSIKYNPYKYHEKSHIPYMDINDCRHSQK